MNRNGIRMVWVCLKKKKKKTRKKKRATIWYFMQSENGSQFQSEKSSIWIREMLMTI